jgi:hypothetical protein
VCVCVCVSRGGGGVCGWAGGVFVGVGGFLSGFVCLPVHKTHACFCVCSTDIHKEQNHVLRVVVEQRQTSGRVQMSG